MKQLTWLGDSRSRVKSFPAAVQDDIGFALYAAQLGEMSAKAKALHVSAEVLWRLPHVMSAERTVLFTPSSSGTQST